jgi:hypothetical protein
MDTSVFPDKIPVPDQDMLKAALGSTYSIWLKIREIVFHRYPDAREEWNYPGLKYGWNFRIKDKKRAILYLLPRNGYFMVAFVFGKAATEQVLMSSVAESIKEELSNARVYAEGRGIRIPVRDCSLLNDIEELISIKLAH